MKLAQLVVLVDGADERAVAPPVDRRPPIRAHVVDQKISQSSRQANSRRGTHVNAVLRKAQNVEAAAASGAAFDRRPRTDWRRGPGRWQAFPFSAARWHDAATKAGRTARMPSQHFLRRHENRRSFATGNDIRRAVPRSNQSHQLGR